MAVSTIVYAYTQVSYPIVTAVLEDGVSSESPSGEEASKLGVHIQLVSNYPCGVGLGSHP
jgi:hypothetical protein